MGISAHSVLCLTLIVPLGNIRRAAVVVGAAAVPPSASRATQLLGYFPLVSMTGMGGVLAIRPP